MSRDVFFRNLGYLLGVLALSVTVSACSATDLKDSGNKPFPPENLVATAAEPGTVEVTLEWEAVFRAESYNVYWILESDLEEALADVLIPSADVIKDKIVELGTKIPKIKTTTYTHTELTGSLTYFYVVTAVTRNGESDPSNSDSAMPIDKPNPPIVTGTTPTKDAFPVWTWTSGGNGNGNYRYKLGDTDLTVDAVETTELTITPEEPGVPNGLYTLYVQEVNDQGKWSDSGFFEISVEGPVPEMPILTVDHLPVDHLTKTRDATPKWSWESGGGGNGTYRYKVDDDDLTVDAIEITDLSFIPAEALADGTHTFYIQERDDPGNWSKTASQDIIVDATAPDAPVVTGDTTPTMNNTPTWTWTAGAGDGNGTFRYKLDNASLSSGATETTDLLYVPAALGDGTHTLYVQERDDIGNWSDSGSYEIIIDSSAPSAPGTPTDIGEYTSSTTVTFTWTPGADNQSGVVSYNLQVGTTPGGIDVFDGDVGNVLTKDVSWTHGKTLYARVQAVNGVALTSAWSGNSDGITIDTSAPSTPGTPTDGPAVYSTDTTVTFSWTLAADVESGVVSYLLQVGTSPGGSDVFDGDVGNVLTKDITGTNGDTLYAKVKAVNGAGTSSAAWSGNSDGIMIDTADPGKPGTPTDAGQYIDNTTVTFEWTAATDGESGVASYTLQVNTASNFSGTDRFNGDVGDVLTKDVTGLEGEILYARVLATDNVAWIGDWSGTSNGIKIDTTLPSTPGVPTEDAPAVYSTSTIIKFDWTLSTDAGSGISSYNLQVNTASNFSGTDVFNDDVGNVLTYNVAGSLGQTLYARVKSTNGAGLDSSYSGASDGILIDTTAPGLPGTPTDGPAEYSSITTITFDWTAATDGESGVASYNVQVGTTPDGIDIFDGNVGNVTTYDATGLNGETLYARVQAINNATLIGDWSGNSDGIKIDTSAPGKPTAPTDAGTWSTSTDVTFDWTAATDTGSGIVSYYLQVGTTPGGVDRFDGDVGNVLTKVVSSGLDTETLYAKVKAFNGAGLDSVYSDNSDGITIDVTDPTTPASPTDGPADYSTSTTVTFDWAAATDIGGSGVASYNLQIGTSAGASNKFSGNVGNVFTYDHIGSEDDMLYGRVQAVDVAGNIGNWSGSSDGIIIDTINPTVLPGTPSSGATNVSLNSTITATFSEAVDPATVIAANITVNNGVTALSITPSGGNTVVTYIPSEWFSSANQSYTITFSTGVTDPATNQLVSNFWSFTTKPKVVAFDGGVKDVVFSNQFGYSVAISGDYAIVGAPFENGGAGAAYIYTRSGLSWGGGVKVIASDGQAANDNFGWSVAISGDYAIVGAPLEDASGAEAGAAYIFNRTGPGNTWDAGTKIMASDAQTLDNFGYSVGITPTYAIVGAPYEDGGGGDPNNDEGAGYIYYNNAGWGTELIVMAGSGAAGDNFGWSVAIDGIYAVVGAPMTDNMSTNDGVAHPLYNTGANAWNYSIAISSTVGDNNDNFGSAVSISSDELIVGAPLEDTTAADSGAAYIFKKNSANFNWGTRRKVIASDPQTGDNFGYSVGMTVGATGKAIVGAYTEDPTGLGAAGSA
jgi:hypothetical protein